MFARFFLQSLSKDRLSVFLFHKVPRQSDPLAPTEVNMARFEHLLDHIFSHLNVLPLEEAIKRLNKGALPRRAACITFDDGYPDWISGVAPALRSRNLHATFFITTGQFDGVPLWHERILAAVRHMPGDLTDLGIPLLPVQPNANDNERYRQVQRLEQSLKYQTLSKREEFLKKLEMASGVFAKSVPVMSENQLRDLHSQGFGIGGHTALHPILDRCSPEETEHEIGGAREILEAIVRGAVNGFAYPNGRPFDDFSADHINAVKRAGYQYAVTTHPGVAMPSTSPFQIPRFTPWAKNDWHVIFQLIRNFRTEPVLVPDTKP